MNTKTLQTLEYDKIISMLTDQAASAPGKKQCRELLPFSNIEDVQLAQKQTTHALDRIRTKGTPSLGGIRELSASLKRLDIGSSLSQAELLHILSVLQTASRAIAYGRHSEEEEFDSLEEYFQTLDDIPSLKKELSRCILSEEDMADDASPELASIRRRMKHIQSRMHSELNSILNAHREYLMEAVIALRDNAYTLPVRSEYKNKVPGVVHDQSSSGSTYFIEPMAVIKMNNELKTLALEEKREIEKILERLSLEAAAYTGILAENERILTLLDFIYAKAQLSRQMEAAEPVFNTRHYIHIKEGRHPLLDKKKVVPISLCLGDTFDLLVITGPNTGGKTVSLKTIGLFTLMGQAGLHIPAFAGSQLSVFDNVFADIGDEQSIEQSLSTFSGHMTKIVRILQEADANSLCLFDELCAGTDPTEGAALAIAILSFLHRMKTRCVATTHYSELKVFALNTPGVENASCEFQVRTLSPTYRILIGTPGKSNAFAISRKLGLGEDIIEEAKTHLAEDAKDFEDLLARLERERQKLERERIQIETLKAEAAALKQQYAHQEERLTAQKEKILEKARAQAQEVLEQAKATADEAIQNINKIASGAGLGSALEKERTKVREALQGAAPKAPKPKKQPPKKTLENLKTGDRVHVLSMNLNGVVSSLPDRHGNLFVQMGILRSQVNIKDLALPQEEAAPEKREIPRSRSSSMVKAQSISPEINVIGKNVDEACSMLDKYLDDALLSHLPEVRIIHGRGTGALQKGIHTYLKRQRFVKEFHLADFNEGGTAITVVHFR